MHDKNLPYSLQVRMRRHFRFYWQRTLTIDVAEDEILDQMSAPLRKEALRIMYAHTMGQLVTAAPLQTRHSHTPHPSICPTAAPHL